MNNNNWKSNYKYRKYQCFIVNPKVVPTPETFQAKNGRMYTRLIFNIPSFNTFSVLDFDYNTVTHMIKLCENQFTEMLLNEINGYIMSHKDDPDPWFKPVQEQVQNGESAKEKKFDHLFDDTPKSDANNTQEQPTTQPQQQEEVSDDDSIWN